MKHNYGLTIKAAFLGYVVQAIVNNFLPLLFIELQQEYRLMLSQITFFITLNFLIQLLVDLLSTPLIRKLGYRLSMQLSNLCVIAGLLLLTILPDKFENHYSGLLLCVCLYAVGGGLQEVLASPIVEACPTKNKEAAMSLLHSFYCWGHVGVVLGSTLFFTFFGIANWRVLALLWCLIPLVDLVLFIIVPIAQLEETAPQQGKGHFALFSHRIFWILLLMMVCAGASEQAVSQWASAFAERGLGISKQLGDLLGPMLFAVCMGISRTIYGVLGARVDLQKFMSISVLLCIVAYLTIILAPIPLLTLGACALTGFAVGIFWPGTFSLAAAHLKHGGTLMFALLALGGDLGCAGGPTLCGLIMSLTADNMRAGIGSAVIFPLLLGLGLYLVCRQRNDVF